jgi:DNA mismatch repair protein MutL
VEIKLLPEDVWARIAAGEVVERPASAVKEMIENSLDAGSRRIRVKLWDGGRVRIVVEDDGSGIPFGELPLALTPHATSKIGGIEDLEAIHTLGYRGEALASLTAVARVEIRSRPLGARPLELGGNKLELGGIIRAYEGRITDHVATNCIPGTRVQVDELFANLPARRKFLKSAAGELRRVTAILREYAICRPEVGFTLENDGRPVFSTDGSGDRRRAIEQLWGAEPEISTAGASAGHVTLECWWQPRQGRNDVIAFVNGRSVADPLIKGAVSSAARELVGAWALFLSVDASLIDVNIHPAKAEIRFRHPSEVFDAVKEASSKLGAPASVYVRSGQAFSANLTESGPRENGVFSEPRGWNFQADPDPAFTGSASRTEVFNPSSPRGGSFHGAGASSAKPSSAPFQAMRPERLFGRVRVPDYETNAQAQGTPLRGGEASPLTQTFAPLESGLMGFPDAKTQGSVSYLGQMGAGYLVFDASEAGNGLVIVDPHAAHERVAFERIRAAAASGSRSQKLLLPALLPPTLRLEAEEKREFLEEAGFALETIDGGLRLTAAPFFAFLENPEKLEPEALLRAFLAVLRDSGNNSGPAELLWRTWATMACGDAVKVTAKLSPEEALALWRDLQACEQPFFCPHGRPAVLKLSLSELAKRFGR